MIASRRTFIAATASAAVFAGPARAQSQFPTLRLGVATVGVYVQAMLANETGIFKKNGLEVNLQDVNNSGASMAAVVGGAMDISIGTPLIVANGVTKGVPLVMIAGGAINTQLSG